MINPGVITLASLNDMENMHFPYRFCVEDNIGESIHIHYKELRLDLTVQEFKNLSDKIPMIIESLVNVPNFSCDDYDPVVLTTISDKLANLVKVEEREIFLNDILVDTFDENGKQIFAPLFESRVYKALCGFDGENNAHKNQFNFFKHGSSEKVSNDERIKFNLEQIKKHGYPYKNELICVNEHNQIWDGQHRAACLLYLYGNIKVKVRTLYYGKSSEEIRNEPDSNWLQLEQSLYEDAKNFNARQLSKKVKRFVKRIFWKPWNRTDKDVKMLNQKLDRIEERVENGK